MDADIFDALQLFTPLAIAELDADLSRTKDQLHQTELYLRNLAQMQSVQNLMGVLVAPLVRPKKRSGKSGRSGRSGWNCCLGVNFEFFRNWRGRFGCVICCSTRHNFFNNSRR